MSICIALKKDGNKCTYKAKNGEYCGIHSKSEKKVEGSIPQKEGEIRFYSKEDPYYCFSNYFPSKIIIDDIDFLSVEHYYQAYKFKNHNIYFDIIKLADSPQKAKDLATQKCSRFSSKWLINKNKPELGYVDEAIMKYKDVKIRDDWEKEKEQIMMNDLFAKFEQNKEFRESLLATKGLTLIEGSDKDFYWGCGKDNTGKNRLGILLMYLRDEMLKLN